MAGGIDAAAARMRWREYEQAMTGKSAVRFSKGLRAHLQMEAAKTDQELAEEEVGGDAGVYLSAPLYRRIFNDGHVPRLLAAFTDAADLGVLRFVQERYPGKYVANGEEYGGTLLLE